MVRSRWWRFSGYEVAGGYIRPKRKAKLTEFDPWASYPQGRDRRDVSPYQELIGIVDAIDLRRGRDLAVPGHDDQAKLCGWCARNGLLGILLQVTHEVTLAPRWEAYGSNSRVQTQARYVREGADWIARPISDLRFVAKAMKGDLTPEEFSAHYIHTKQAAAKMNSLLTAKEALSFLWPAPNAVITESTEIKEETLATTWGRFFPSVQNKEKETYPYPVPLSEAFWRIYAEPVEDFIRAVNSLRHAIELNATETTRADGVQFFNNLLRVTRMYGLIGADGQLEQHWAGPSLLSYLAVMAWTDLLQGTLVMRCSHCTKLFLAKRPNAKYCKRECRQNALQRRHRAKFSRKNASRGPRGGGHSSD